MIMLLRWWVGIFLVAAVLFAVFPGHVIYWLNTIGHVLFNWSFKPLPEPSEHFWQVLAVSLLVVLTVVSFNAQSDIRQNLSDVRIILISKFATAFGFLIAFIFSGHYFAYLVGMVVDFLIFLLTWVCYRRTVVSLGL